MNFLEWAVQHEIEESAKHAYGRDVVSMSDPKQGDLIITNAQQFMNSLITRKTGLVKKGGGQAQIGDKGSSKWTVVGLKDGQPVIRSVSYSKGGGPKLVGSEDLLDVTPAFDDGGGKFSQLDVRQSVFVYNNPRYKSHANVKNMWQSWWSQAAQPQADLSMTRVGAELDPSGESAKRQQNQKADQERERKAQEVLTMIQGFKEGRQVGGITYESLLDEMKSMAEDARNVQWLRSHGYGDIIDTLHDVGEPVAGEEVGSQPPQTPPEADWDKMFNQPQQAGNPAVDPAVASAAGQYTGQHQPPQPANDDDEFWNRMRQNASYDPSIMSHTRHWKRHNDIKRYDYFAE